MSREIKFRGWNKSTKKMVDLKAITPLAMDSSFMQDGLFIPFHDEIVLMQYIDLKDKNGQEIYESDIVRILYTDWPSQPIEKNGRYAMSLDAYKKSISRFYQVKYFAPSFYAVIPDTDACNDLVAGAHGEIEVVGNIYENPELLNKY